MSDPENDSAKGSQEEQEEENPELPLMVTKDQLTKGLSRIQRTHGKSYTHIPYSLLISFIYDL